MIRNAERPLSRWSVIGYGAALFALLPLSTDIYLAAMPEIAREFDTSLAGVKGTLAAFMLGFALAHVVIGGLADHFGRRRVAIAALCLYAVCGLAGAMTASLEMLIALRFLQGCAGAAGPILMRALVRDTTPPAEAGRVLSLTGALIGFAPMLAPVIGAVASQAAGWRMTFGLLAAYGLLLATSIAWRLPETLRADFRAPHLFGSPLRALVQLVGNASFLLGSLVLAFGYGALFTWLSTSAFLLIRDLGMMPYEAAAIYAFGSTGFISGGLISAWLAARLAPARILLLASAIATAGTAACYALLELTTPNSVLVVLTILPFYVGWGIAQPQAIAIAMRPFLAIAGQASSWLGAIQQIGGILLAWIAVQLGGGHASVAVMIASCIGLGIVSLRLLRCS